MSDHDPEHPFPDRPIHLPMGGPPPTDKIPEAVFVAMGEANIMAMALAFYRRLHTSPAAVLFPKGEAAMDKASEKTGALFVFLFGGPHLYQQRYGSPRMRMRHMPFQIGPKAREEWMRCLRETLDEAPAKFAMPAEHIPAIVTFFEAFSGWMVNAEDDAF